MQNGQPITPRSLRQNAILSVLSDSSAGAVIEDGMLVHLALRQQVYESEELIVDVYFPLDCVLSAIVRMKDGGEIEVGTIGREGMSAAPLLTGASSTANVCYCQVRGSAIRISATLFRELIAADPAFRLILDHYLQAYINILAQLVACNSLHGVYQRCARWLLMTRDRVDFDAIPLTQEFLAMMLGSSRSGVATATAALQRAGFIKYASGTITILDRAGLERASCECYAIARREFERVVRAIPSMSTSTKMMPSSTAPVLDEVREPAIDSLT